MPRSSPRTKCSLRKPHFFKVLLGDFEHRLKIPPKFMKHIAKEASHRVILQGPNGSSWQVELRETIKGNFLSAGWSNFVKDHSLKEYEFLVFRYEGNMHFDVMIFDTTACEREDSFEMKTPKKSTCDGKSRRCSTMKRSLGFNCIVQHQSSRGKLLKLLSDNKHRSKQLQGLHVSSKSARNRKTKPEDAELPIHTTCWQTVYLSRRRYVTQEEKSKAQEAANSFCSVFPYTIIRMSAGSVYRIFMLRFTRLFSRKHLPRKKTDMVLRDPSGKSWIVAYIPGRDRDHLSAGWSAFARGNNLEEGDLCALELVGEVEFRVHIFRVVEETTPLVRSRFLSINGGS